MYGRTTARKWPRSVCASSSLRHERFEQGLGPGLGPGVEDVETAAPEAPVREAHAVLFSRAGHIRWSIEHGMACRPPDTLRTRRGRAGDCSSSPTPPPWRTPRLSRSEEGGCGNER